MEDKKNLVIAIALCFGIMLVWQAFAPRPEPRVGKPATAVEEKKTGERAVAAKPGTGPSASGPSASGTPQAAPPEAPGDGHEPAGVTPRPPEEEIALDTPQATFVLTSHGASLKRVLLKGEKFRHEGGKGKEASAAAGPLEIVRAENPERTPLLVDFPRSDFALPEGVAWTVATREAGKVVFRAETAEVAVTKTFSLAAEEFRLRFVVEVENRSTTAQKHNLVLRLFGRQDPEKKSSGFYDYASASIEELVCHVNGKVERAPIEKFQDKPVDLEGTLRWLAADERFFTVAVVPAAQEGSAPRKCGQRAIEPGLGEVFAAMPVRKLDPGATTRYPFEVFAGPKFRAELAAVPMPREGAEGTAAAGEPSELDLLVNVTFAFLSRPLLALLKMFQKIVGNWGLAIILLTLVVRLVTFYPAHRQLLSGKKMARLAPKLAEMKKRYGDDRERIGRETMNLYKAHGVNPLGGCLPALIQMPIWIALFSTLSYSVELYRSSFFAHIVDLSNPDPYYIAPLIMGVVMFVQMRMSPAGADPQQQKMMAVMMPVMFTGFSLFLPAGLAVYTLTSYSWGIAHQLLVNRMDKQARAVEAAGGAKSVA